MGNTVLENLKRKLATWMQGRYGMDELSIVLFVVALALMLIDTFFDVAILMTIALVISLFVLFRCYSKNRLQRIKELQAYNKIIKKPKAWLMLTIKRIKNRKTTLYYKCDQCKTVCSVPRGKGNIRATCPKCKAQAIRKS